MLVTITEGKRDKIEVSVNGLTYSGAFTSDTHARQASKRLGIPAAWLDDAVVKFRRNGTTEHDYSPDDDSDTPGDVFAVRNITQVASKATPHDTFDAALQFPDATPDHVIEWKDASEAAALDFDWHDGTTPPADLIDHVYHANPLPSYAWVTRSGGLRLIYLRQGDTPADALAAVAAYGLYPRIKPPVLELKTTTRFAPGEVTTFDGGFDLSAVKAVFDDHAYDVATRDEYMESNGLALGQRYPHDQCPIDPNRTSSSPDPVQVLEDGIKCYSCSSRSGGFRSWYQILGRSVPTEVAVCVRSFTHWEHAEYVIRPHVNLPESLLKAFYRAALIVSHGADDARIASVFRPRDLIRFDGFWGTTKGQMRKDDKIRFTLAGLPAVLGHDGKPDNERHERFSDKPTLEEWGYYPLKRVYGSRISTLLMTPRDGRPRIEIAKGTKPEYLPLGSRVSEEAAWGLLETAFPGVRPNLIKFLVFCRGWVEYGATNAPMFLFEGVSGSGKTGSPKLAAAICGDACADIVPTEKDERFFSQILESVHNTGTFISISEVVKAARRFKIQPLDYLNFMLQITPDMKAHVMYQGPVPMVDVPVLTISDTEFTDEILRDAQLGRRLYYFDLGTEYNAWKEAAIGTGLSSLFAVRSQDNFRQAVDSLLSHWIDYYWSSDTPFDIDEVARELGIPLLNTRTGSADRADDMRALFAAWKSYAGATGAIAQRQGRGFKAFKIDPDKIELARVWVRLHDEGNPVTWSRANERSWAGVLGRAQPVKLVVKRLYADRESWVQLSFQENVKGDVWTVIE